jgi:iron(III) transport system substrate-binding protein
MFASLRFASLRSFSLGCLLSAAAILSTSAVASESPAQLYAAAKQEGGVVMYTSVPTFILDQWKVLFEKQYPGIALSYFRSGTGKVLARVDSEARAGKIGGDLAWMADETAFSGMLKSGLMADSRSPEWEKVKFAKEPGGHYVAGRILLGMLFVNDAMSNPPASLADLVKPEYKGKIVIASPLVSGSMNIMVSELLNDPRFGLKFFEKLKENDVLVLNDVPDVARSVAAGERPVGLTLSMYKYQPEFKNSPIKMVMPKEGGLLITSPLGVFKDAPHPNAARLLARFLLSPDAQAVLAESGIYPARIDVKAPAGLPVLGSYAAFTPDAEWTLAHKAENVQRWRQLFGH